MQPFRPTPLAMSAVALATAFTSAFAAADEREGVVTHDSITYTVVNNTSTPLPDPLPPGTSPNLGAGDLYVSCDGTAFQRWAKDVSRDMTCSAAGTSHTLTYSWPLGVDEAYSPGTVVYDCSTGETATLTFTGSGDGIVVSQSCSDSGSGSGDDSSSSDSG